ncbi:MAG: hypothetical protein ACOX3S_02020 [Anaerolineae bacterium]|jgi:hypothetical protein
MAYSMIEAYQVKMEQLADDIKATCPACAPNPGVLTRTVERVRQMLMQRRSAPGYYHRLLSGIR